MPWVALTRARVPEQISNMITRALDEILRAADALPQHLAALRRDFGHNPAAVQACERLGAALAEARAALAPRPRQS
jgi:hypothetical protein